MTISAPKLDAIDPTSIYSLPMSLLLDSDQNTPDYRKATSLSSSSSSSSQTHLSGVVGTGQQPESSLNKVPTNGSHPTGWLFAVCLDPSQRSKQTANKPFESLSQSRPLDSQIMPAFASSSCWISDHFDHKMKHNHSEADQEDQDAFGLKLATNSKNNQQPDYYLASDSKIPNHFGSQSIELASAPTYSYQQTLRQVFELYLIISCHLYSYSFKPNSGCSVTCLLSRFYPS